MTRTALPARRSSLNFTIPFQSEKYDVTVGFYAQATGGAVGEVFISRVKDRVAAKLGMQLDGACRDAGVLLSLALQHGVSLETVRHAVTRDEDNEAASLIGEIVDKIIELTRAT